MSKLSEFVEKNNVPGLKPDLQQFLRDLFDEIEKAELSPISGAKRGHVTVADIRTVFERFTGSDMKP